jgi:2-acylglycerol O-acyltransferase 2
MMAIISPILQILVSFTLFVSMLFHPTARQIALIYLAYIYLDSSPTTGGWRFSIQWCRKLSISIWRSVAEYFPATLVRTTPLEPSKKYVLGYHPHGIFFCGLVYECVV